MYAIGIPDFECGTCWWDFKDEYFQPEMKLSCLVPTTSVVADVLKSRLDELVKSLIETGEEDIEAIEQSIQIFEICDLDIEDSKITHFDDCLVGRIVSDQN